MTISASTLPRLNPAVKRRVMALFCEHLPCCGLSMAAGFLHLPFVKHNPVIEFCFMIAAAIGFEYFYHSRTHKHGPDCSHGEVRGIKGFIKIYGLALTLGLASWFAHQLLFHHPHDAQHAAAKQVIVANHAP